LLQVLIEKIKHPFDIVYQRREGSFPAQPVIERHDRIPSLDPFQHRQDLHVRLVTAHERAVDRQDDRKGATAVVRQVDIELLSGREIGVGYVQVSPLDVAGVGVRRRFRNGIVAGRIKPLL